MFILSYFNAVRILSLRIALKLEKISLSAAAEKSLRLP